MCFMGLFAVLGFTANYHYQPTPRQLNKNGWTDRQMDGHYQTHYLPGCFVVGKNFYIHLGAIFEWQSFWNL